MEDSAFDAYIVMYENGDLTAFYGVYSTLKKAQARRSALLLAHADFAAGMSIHPIILDDDLNGDFGWW